MTLLELAEHFGENVGEDRIMIRQKIKQPDLAAMAGIARENLNRILADWKRRKLVSEAAGYYSLKVNLRLSTRVTFRCPLTRACCRASSARKPRRMS